MLRALAPVAILLAACASGHQNSGNTDAPGNGSDASSADSNRNTPDSPPGTPDSPPGTPDARKFDAPPGTPDARPDARPVDANNCPTQPCTLSPQCGCDMAAGNTCDIDPATNNSTICRHVNTPGTETSTCSSIGDCAYDYVCLGDGACHKYCSINNDCAQPRGQCVIQVVDQNNNPINGAVICSSNCDPQASASAYCPAGDKCAIFTATFMGTDHDITDCEAFTGTGTQGTDCTIAGPNGDDTKCAAQYSCTTLNGTTFQCRHYCHFNGTTGVGCSTGSCLHFNPALTIGGTEYGVCN